MTLTGYVLKRDPDFRTGDSLRIANYQITALDYENAFIPEFAVKELETKPEPDKTDSDDADSQGTSESKPSMSEKDRERLKFQLKGQDTDPE